MKKNDKRYILTCSLLFTLVAVLHFVRIVYNLDLVLDGWVIPIWVSWAVAGISVALALYGYTCLFAKRS